MSYLIENIAYGLHLWYKVYIFKESCREPISEHPGLGKGLLLPCNEIVQAKDVLEDLSLRERERESYSAFHNNNTPLDLPGGEI